MSQERIGGPSRILPAAEIPCPRTDERFLEIDVLAYFLGDLQRSVKRMSDGPHHMVCLMEDFQSHLRAGCHNCVGAVRAVADDDVLAAVLLELQVVLNLSRTVARA